MLQIQMFADLSCPFAYLVHASWREIRSDYQDRVELRHRSLALEYVNNQPTPKTDVSAELHVLMQEEPTIAYQPWQAADSAWPVTILPAFEAVKCAEKQSAALADDLAWSIRTAFFAQSKCISMRHILLELAGKSGLDQKQFERDYDSGACRAEVIEEARAGWEQLLVPGSPTWVFPDASQNADFGLANLDVDDNGRVHLRKRALPTDERVTLLRRLIDQHLP